MAERPHKLHWRF